MRELIEVQGRELSRPTGHSADKHDPIGEASPEIEEVPRRAAARGREALVERMGRALSVISSRDAPQHLRACRLPSYGTTAVTRAVRNEQVEPC